MKLPDNEERRPRPESGAQETSTNVESSTHHRSLVVDRATALRLTAEGIPATTIEDVNGASAEELGVYLDGRPAVFVRPPRPGFDLDEMAAMEKVIASGGRVKVGRVGA